jgi:YaiO family outer membrane protein
MNYGYDSLTKSYDPWQTAGAGISFRLSDKLTFTGESNIYRRFGLEDNTESVGITVNPSKMFGVSVAFQKCNNAEILPENRFNLNAMFNFGKWTSLSAGYNYFDFTEEKVNVVTAGIERYFLKHLSLSYQYFNSHALKTNSPNHLFRIGYSVERKFGVFGGYSTGREVYRILASQKPGVINGFSYIIGANYWITPFLGVNINSSFTSRKNYYDSKSAGGGFIWKF